VNLPFALVFDGSLESNGQYSSVKTKKIKPAMACVLGDTSAKAPATRRKFSWGSYLTLLPIVVLKMSRHNGLSFERSIIQNVALSVCVTCILLAQLNFKKKNCGSALETGQP
jgi:hypothetical protein